MSHLFVLSVLAKGLLVLSVALALGLLLRRASAAVRHGVWVAAFAALLLLPVLELAGPKWTVPFELAPVVTERVAAPAPVFLEHPPAPPAPPPPPPPAPPAPPPAPSVLAHEAALEAQAAALEHRAAAMERHAHAVARHAESEAERQLDRLRGDLERLERQLERRVERDVSVFGTVSHPAPHVAVVSPGSVVQTFRSIPRELVLAVLWFWGLGALAVGLAWGVAYAAAARAVRLGQPETDEDVLAAWERIRLLSGLERPVRLLRSPALDVPIAWGWGSAAVVLPATADTWGEDRLEAVLLHELAHVQRGDAASQLVAQVALVLHWANPLAWLAYRRFLLDREHACDDVVLEHGARPSAYADHLVQVARDLRRRSAALAAVSPMARTSNLEGRVLSILDPARRRSTLGRTAALTLAALLAAVVLPLAAFQPVAASPAACQPPAECPAPSDDAWAVAPLDDASPIALDAPAPLGDVEVGELAELHKLAELAELTVFADADVELASDASGIDLQLALDTIPDFDEIIRPALERALEAVRAMRNSPNHRQLGLDDDEWDEIEEEIQGSIEDARDDYEEAIEGAIEEAMEDVDRERWDETGRRADRDQIRSRALRSHLRRAQAERERAMDRARRDIQRAEAEIQRELEREDTRAEARGRAAPRSRTISRARSVTVSNGRGRVTTSGPNGDTEEWMHGFDNLEDGLDGIELALDAVGDDPPPGVVAGLHGGLVGLRTGMVEFRKQGRAAARTDADRRSIEQRAAQLEDQLDALDERLADCSD